MFCMLPRLVAKYPWIGGLKFWNHEASMAKWAIYLALIGHPNLVSSFNSNKSKGVSDPQSPGTPQPSDGTLLSTPYHH